MHSRHAYHRFNRHALLLPCALSLIALLVAAVGAALAVQPVQAATPHVDVAVLNNEDISAATLRFLSRAIDNAQQDGARALVIEIDTPGGDIEAMKSITQKELASSVPIIAYVSPAGGRAASAGAFVELAAQVAAMAPTTRIGASSPVASNGSNLDSTLQSKIENDLVAGIQSIQTRYQRNVPLAVQMVTQAKSYDDATAIRAKLVDLGAPSLSALLDKVDGREVVLSGGHTVVLQTRGVSVQTLGETPLDTFYGFLLDPNVLFLLFVVAMIGIYLEVSHPGVILPGVLGSIALILFLFGAGSLTPDWAGLALMVLAFVLLVLDVRLPTHGTLTVGAVISLIIGAFLFFDNGNSYGVAINPVIVYAMGGLIALLGFTLVTFVVRAQRRPVTTGIEGMVGARVVALTPLLPDGRVSYAGEDWAAILDSPATSADPGSVLRIASVEGLRLHVQPERTHLS